MISIDTVVRCTTMLCDRAERTLTVGTDVPVNSAIQYSHKACYGGALSAYTKDNECLYEYEREATTDDTDAVVGGGFIVQPECGYIHIGATLTVYNECLDTVASIIKRAANLMGLLEILATTDLRDEDLQQVINLYFEYHTSEGISFEIGNGLKLEDNSLSVDCATDYLGDNTRPIETAFVQRQVGNIEILLETI